MFDLLSHQSHLRASVRILTDASVRATDDAAEEDCEPPTFDDTDAASGGDDLVADGSRDATSKYVCGVVDVTGGVLGGRVTLSEAAK